MAVGLLLAVVAVSSPAGASDWGWGHYWRFHFVPNSQAFWDFSKNWTTNYGPAYRDTVEQPENMVPCTGRYALCFESGPEPLPCELSKDGRFANCTCTVREGINFVLISAILNHKVYLETIKVCGADGSDCPIDQPDKAPVCKAIQKGKLIPGADLISTFGPDEQTKVVNALAAAPSTDNLTICPKGPYAGCMTAPCEKTKNGLAQCSCPVFYGIFQLHATGVQCTLEDDLVWSASYTPALDVSP
jgi:hypothetical protein